MTALIRKFRRKRKLSSELHSRWGDVSITYPTEGSWSQCDQQPVVNVKAASEVPPEQCRRHSSLDSHHRQSSSSQPERTLRRRDTQESGSSGDSAMTIPAGYYDAKVRHRPKRSSAQKNSENRETCEQRGFSHPWDDLNSSDEAGEDIMPASKGPKEPRPPESTHPTGNPPIDPYSRVPKSPPLSVTSRMRHYSQQSTVAEPTASVSGTASSKHTSFTSSVPSVPSEDPRNMLYPPPHEKKLARRSKPREPESARGQELVPSYDELYG